MAPTVTLIGGNATMGATLAIRRLRLLNELATLFGIRWRKSIKLVSHDQHRVGKAGQRRGAEAALRSGKPGKKRDGEMAIDGRTRLIDERAPALSR